MCVLVKGMQKPKDCELCPFEQDGFPDEWEMHCKRLGRQVGYFGEESEIPSDCPIVDVPTPHGRLIDADALQQSIGSYNPVKYTYEYGDVITVADIDTAPTIIEAEEVCDEEQRR